MDDLWFASGDASLPDPDPKGPCHYLVKVNLRKSNHLSLAR